MSHDFDPNSVDSVLSRVTTVLDRVEKRLEDGDATFKNHDSRITALEQWRWWVLGICAVLGVVLPLLPWARLVKLVAG